MHLPEEGRLLHLTLSKVPSGSEAVQQRFEARGTGTWPAITGSAKSAAEGVSGRCLGEMLAQPLPAECQRDGQPEGVGQHKEVPVVGRLLATVLGSPARRPARCVSPRL